MCGIFGYIGSENNAADKVFNGLIDIEYRGYDSWGVAYFQNDSFKVVKKTGFLPKTYDFPASNISIGHTRW
ncbi:MAG: glutamine--fructose-6-phosphate aminotransferase, partial [Candidatus Daviesbacteria bacterium]|nr:glutamine--fructose-6-phosphate aminotransferase [Candidatus Daviesbacteria bacterium]